MSYSPTVIAASLSDEQLKQSINNLVQYVEKKTGEMSQSFTDAVAKMKEQLKSLGNVNFSIGGGSDNVANKAVANAEKLTEAMQKSEQAAVKSARESYIAFMQGFKEQERQLQGWINNWESLLVNRQIQRIKGIDEEISRISQKIKDIESTPTPNRKQQIGEWQQRIENLRRLQQFLNANPTYGQDKTYLTRLYAERVRISNIMKEDVNTQKQITAETQNTAKAARQYSEESINAFKSYRANIKEYAALVREKMKDYDSSYSFTGRLRSDITGKTYLAQIYAENDARSNGLTIEEQILRLMRERHKDEEMYLQTQKQVTEEISKQAEQLSKKAYKAPGEGGGYNRMLANVLGIDETKIKGTSDRLDKLTAALKQYQTAYSKLSGEARESPFGKALRDDIQYTERLIRQIRSEMTRPVNLNSILGIKPYTIDEIREKIQLLQRYLSGIDFTEPKGKKEIEQVTRAISELQKKQAELLGQNKTLLESNNALARSWNYMKNRLAFYFTVGASTQFLKNLIEVRSQYEMNERALGILINSAERGTQIFQELSNMALISPYTVIELTAAAKQLTAYGVAARDVTETTRRLADMASAVGVPMERLTYALGQIKAYGYLNSRDNRMFANAGIPLVKELADYYTQLEGKLVSTADVYDRIKKKAVDYNDVIQVINKMTDEGGKFFDFQAKMADTLKVRLANLNLAWNNMLNDIGKNTQGILTWTIGALRDLFLHWKEFDSAVWSLFWAGGLIVGFRALNVLLVKSGFQWRILSKEMTAAQIAGAGVERRFLGIKSALGALVKSPLTWWSLLAFAIVDVTRSIINMDEAQKQLNESIRKGAEDNYNNVSQFLSNYQKLRDSLYVTTNGKTTPQNIDKSEASKAWESIREQIELTVKNADEYIGKLLSIQNISERVRQGFNLLDDIQAVNAALNELDKDSIKISDDFKVLGMSISDGLVQDLKGFIENEKGVIDTYGSIEAARKAIEDDGKKDVGYIYDNYKYSLRELQREVDKTTQSILNFIEIKGWSGDTNKINLAFSQIIEKVALEKNLSPKEYFYLQVEAESARTEALKQALKIRIDTEKTELAKARKENEKAAIRERLNTLNTELRFLINNTDESKVYWNNFIKWMGSQHKSEVQRMFKDMTSEEIKALDFSKGEWKKWVDELVAKYAKEHKMGIDEVHKHLKNFIYNANQYSIRIPLIISSEGVKSEFETLSEADSALDAALNKIERLNKRRSELEKQGASMAGTRDIDKEYAKTLEEIASAEKDAADARAKGGHSKNEEKERTKQQKQAESELQKALKSELQLIEKVSSAYNELTKSGTTHFDAIKKSTEGFDESVANINKVLSKYGLNFDLSKFAGTQNPREIVNMLQQQIDTLLKNPNAKPAEIQDLQVEVQKLNLKVETFDQKTLTDSLNNQLSKLKDEYELAVELDANPELGDLFASFMGIDKNSLPRTFEQAVRNAQIGIDKIFKENGRIDTVDIASMLDRESFDKWVKDSALRMDSELVKAIEQFRQYLHKVQVDENKKITQEWDNLIGKYGDLQAKMLKIYKDNVKEQLNIIRKFGDYGNETEAIDLVNKINISEDPAEIARLQKELAVIMQDVVNRNPEALKLITAVDNAGNAQIAKATWEDFKESDLYTMTFEDMSRNSTRAIQLIIEKLETLKDKVKEDPAAMKALMKSLQDANKELEGRSSTTTIGNALKEYSSATKDVADAKKELADADVEVSRSERALDLAKSTEDAKALADANERLEKARKKQEEATLNLTKAENKQKASVEKLKSGMNVLSSELQNVQGLFSTVSKLFRAAGDDKTADAIDAINEGFSVMTTVIMGVVAALILLQSCNPWLLAIAAALSVIVGLVSFLSGSSDKKIQSMIKDSELAVKRLEVSYKNLQNAEEDAFGTAVMGAQQAMKANRELQLVELKRQLALEQRRDGKHRDEERIASLRGEIIDLEHEIAKATLETFNNLANISSFGDLFQSMIDEMIDAFKQGEDAMKVFSEKWEAMIDSLVGKMIYQQIVSVLTKDLEKVTQGVIEKYTKNISKSISDTQKQIDYLRSIDPGDISEWIYKNDNAWFNQILKNLGFSESFNATPNKRMWFNDAWNKGWLHQIADAYFQMLQNSLNVLNDESEKASLEATKELIPTLTEWGKTIQEGGYLQDILDRIQDIVTPSNDAQLSALQQGIQGITEDTAGALEAYMNGVSQQVYLQSDLLTQIRDAVIGFNMDASLGVQSQMLFELQQSYAVQMAIQNILTGWSSANGLAVKVEMV